MTPEMFLGESHSFVVDSWAMGCVLYEMLTAKRAFNEPVGRVEKKGDRWKIDTKISFSPDISEVLAGLLQFKPKYRWNMQQVSSEVLSENTIKTCSFSCSHPIGYSRKTRKESKRLPNRSNLRCD